MRLDFLQNYPLNSKSNQILMDYSHPNISPIIPQENTNLKQKAKELAQIFGGNSVNSFGFGFCDWFTLFSQISKSHQIAYAISNHQQANQASKHLQKKPKKLIINPKSGVLEIKSINEAIHQNCNCFIIPFINQDILTINDISTISKILQEKLKDFILIIDISYAQSSMIPIPKILDKNTIFLLNSESLGILRGNGVSITKDFFDPELLCDTLGNIKLFDALLHAIKNPTINITEDTKTIFYEKLKTILKENLSLFAPLEYTLPNALPLRFHSIKARVFLQNLLIEDIHAINGQECLFGFSKPSFVLQEMGYSESQARELVSISYAEIQNIDKISEILSRVYFQIRSIGI
ncbi:hypothetical protein [Helicobacter cappadocius]|uniref:Cysteine desulfurase n=1 Tax=Helicobacter cappadocius TaxID=3063998 RepID=A0AA90PIP6_9HELI|nr:MULTISPECIES: hypothetical protein [unclassified Helicobacter]MDO7253029.1 hypothetical protein [Helicobacter sp. faydin-H75]MDP2538982.1 hypothetical protein [Helicobacter sp. faydin-H76]